MPLNPGHGGSALITAAAIASGAAEANEASEPALLLLQQCLRGLGLDQSGTEEEDEDDDDDDGGGEAELREDEDDEGAWVLPRGRDVRGGRGRMAAMLWQTGAGVGAIGSEKAALLRKKSVNTTECVAAPSSEHVADIVGRQGRKIKALRAKTDTYIKTPVQGEQPVFTVTGRRENVAAARRETLSAAEHFGPDGACRAPALPQQTTARVRVPYRMVGLVVGPGGATVKRIQQQTDTYIVTPKRDREPVFEVTGAPDNVERARKEIEAQIASDAGAFPQLRDDGDSRADRTDVGFQGGPAWPGARAHAGRVSGYRSDSSSEPGSGSTDSYFSGSRPADCSPPGPFGGFWIGEALPAAGAEELALDAPAYEPLPAPSPTIWAPLEPAGGTGAPRRSSRPPTPRPSPACPEGLERPLAGWARGDPPGSGPRPGLPVDIPAFSSASSSYFSSSGGSTSSSPSQGRRRRSCAVCFEGEATATLVPCGHDLFCLQCTGRICTRDVPTCPVCQAQITLAIHVSP
ncbi:unnamed protein product [Coccothraustes coccothraustes]